MKMLKRILIIGGLTIAAYYFIANSNLTPKEKEGLSKILHAFSFAMFIGNILSVEA